MRKLTFTSTAKKQIQKLDKDIQKQLFQAFSEKLLITPQKYLVPLVGKLKGLYKFRVGSYRCICEKQNETFTIITTHVAHRKDVYRK